MRTFESVAELAAAFAPSRERHLETTAQGRAFLDTTRAAWPAPAFGPPRLPKSGAPWGAMACRMLRARSRPCALWLEAMALTLAPRPSWPKDCSGACALCSPSSPSWGLP